MNPDQNGIKVLFFDLMGTCLDWYTGIVESFPARISHQIRSELALAWRQAFFDDIHERFDKGLPSEDIDVTHARLLARLVAEDGGFPDADLDEQEQQAAVRAWHRMTAWLDVPEALKRLRSKFEVFVLANGTTRLQLDLATSSKLEFNMLFSSQLLGQAKPAPSMYTKALELVGAKPEESIMIAAHAYDLRAAKGVGMRTVYIQRTTEDQHEDMDQVRKDVDLFIDGRDGTAFCGLWQVAHLIEA